MVVPYIEETDLTPAGIFYCGLDIYMFRFKYKERDIWLSPVSQIQTFVRSRTDYVNRVVIKKTSFLRWYNNDRTAQYFKILYGGNVTVATFIDYRYYIQEKLDPSQEGSAQFAELIWTLVIGSCSATYPEIVTNGSSELSLSSSSSSIIQRVDNNNYNPTPLDINNNNYNYNNIMSSPDTSSSSSSSLSSSTATMMIENIPLNIINLSNSTDEMDITTTTSSSTTNSHSSSSSSNNTSTENDSITTTTTTTKREENSLIMLACAADLDPNNNNNIPKNK
ncbi:hypothetical protein DFA_02435 [Cavenderia fasciculata]|uniref:Uncharacterized protein n=1 Tax=Cavenderia fasciculata TaxID=261658 RepID=F4PZF8_CACFS|nr:uncharacterized protein DFA_02435 [Cavenderia fasciculata]EGG19187.1 hypothetical protein DFA_02435 [Cavenderia fasciculata]|eukprot:XP_004366820.1 hypothetical protein DFA_02435 [Cavenderia fasciculata]